MTVNIETAVAWFEARLGKVSYSMQNRNGSSSYDCSSAIYYALREAGAGAYAGGYAVNTEVEHDWLIANGYELIAEETDWDMVRGDVIIWGKRGYSAGAGGHTMLAINSNDVIHCSYGYNGINVNNYNQYYNWCGQPYVYVYRLKAVKSPTVVNGTVQAGTIETLAGEVMQGKHGSGETRKKALGSYYNAVQTVINERLKVISSTESHKRLARSVLNAELGNGDQRKKALGSYYNTVQHLINTGQVR